jgi:large subunit ribosomal protein L10
MAISRQKKEAVVAEFAELLAASKMSAFAQYQGLTVAELQELRRAAREVGVTVKVVKNRLVRVAVPQVDALKDVDTSALTGQLMYATSTDDDVAPAQILAKFAKTHPALKLAGAISAEGKLLSEAEVSVLATMPSKNQLIGEVLATLAAPLNDTINGLSGNLHALLDGVATKATA